MRSLKEAMSHARKQVDPDTAYDYECIGQVQDFDRRELAKAGKGILIREHLVLFQAIQSLVHYDGVRFLQNLLQDQAGGSQYLQNGHWDLKTDAERPALRVHDIFGCTLVADRQPDVRMDLFDELGDPLLFLLIGEVIFRAGNFSRTLSIGAAYLASHTNFVYVLLAILEENGHRTNVESITYVVMARRSEIAQVTDTPLPADGLCRPEPSVATWYSDEILGGILGVEIIRRFRVTRRDIQNPLVDCRVRLPVEQICRLTLMRPEFFSVDELVLDARGHAASVFADCDQMVAKGTYPYSPVIPKRPPSAPAAAL